MDMAVALMMIAEWRQYTITITHCHSHCPLYGMYTQTPTKPQDL